MSKKVLVVMGGFSAERDVSLVSGKGIIDALKQEGFETVAHDLTSTSEFLDVLKKDGAKNVDACYLPTLKNAQVSEFYDKFGFACLGKNEDGSKDYRLNLDDADLTVSEIYNIEMR